jgi:hypothetical protein
MKKHKTRFDKLFTARMREARQKILPQKLPKIFLGMPSYEGVMPLTVSSLQRSDRYFAERGILLERYGPIGVSHIDKARNDCVDMFMKTDCTHLLWVDDDMAWNPEDLEKMLSYNVDVVSALVTKKGPPFNPTIYQIAKDSTGQLASYALPLGSFPIDEPFWMPHSGIGTAFMLVKRHVIEKIPQPCFASPPTSHGKVRGEDFYFCMQMDANGFDILYDPTVRVYHMGFCLFGIEDWLVYKKMFPEQKEGIIMGDLKVEEVKAFYAGPQPSYITENAPFVKEMVKKRMELMNANTGIPMPEVPDSIGGTDIVEPASVPDKVS